MNVLLGEKVSELILKLFMLSNIFSLEEKCVHQGHIFYTSTAIRLYNYLRLILSRR